MPDVRETPFDSRFPARFGTGTRASVPEGVGDSHWDGDTQILSIADDDGTAWEEYDLGSAGGGAAGGGTGFTSYVKGDLLVGNAGTTLSKLPVGATDGHPLFVDSGEALGVRYDVLAVVGGGTGIDTVATGDLIVASSTNNFVIIPLGTVGKALVAASPLPVWGTVGVNGGGTSYASYTKGDILVATGAAALAKLTVGANGKILVADSAQSSGVKWDDQTSGIMFTQTADKTTTNTTSSTSLFGTGVGTLTIPAARLIAGTTIRLHLSGKANTAPVTPGTLNIRISIGGVLAINETFNLPVGANGGWSFDATLTLRTTGVTGTMQVGAATLVYPGAVAPLGDVYPFRNASTITIDTTGTLVIDAPIIYGTALVTNSNTTQVATVEIFDPD